MRYFPSFRVAALHSALACGLLAHSVISPAQAAPAFHQYVALGDSYASAAGQSPLVDGGPCNRSAHNYPAVVADRLGLDREAGSYVDVSCSGATTADVVNTQLDAVTSDTDLVTLTIGGDDGGLFIDAIFICNVLGATDFLDIGRPCEDHGPEQRPVLSPQGLADDFDVVRSGVGEILSGIRSRAPKAKVLVVNYPRLFTPGVKCSELGGVATGDTTWLDSIERRLNAVVASAAAAGGAQLVDVYSQSLGNGICAGAQAWVAGISPSPGAALPYHPLAAGSDGVGRLALSSLGR